MTHYIGPKRGLDDERDHWREYERQQADAARRTCAWDHADEPPARTWPQLLAYAAVVTGAAVLIVRYGLFA